MANPYMGRSGNPILTRVVPDFAQHITNPQIPCTEVGFTSFLSSGFIATEVNPMYVKLANSTSVL